MAVRAFSARRLPSGVEVVVAVAGISGSEALQRVLEVLEQPGLVLVDHQGHGGVPALHDGDTLAHPGKPHALREERGQVDELEGLLGPEVDEVAADTEYGPFPNGDEEACGHGTFLPWPGAAARPGRSGKVRAGQPEDVREM
jgi:hypothetical protein